MFSRWVSTEETIKKISGEKEISIRWIQTNLPGERAHSGGCTWETGSSLPVDRDHCTTRQRLRCYVLSNFFECGPRRFIHLFFSKEDILVLSWFCLIICRERERKSGGFWSQHHLWFIILKDPWTVPSKLHKFSNYSLHDFQKNSKCLVSVSIRWFERW